MSGTAQGRVDRVGSEIGKQCTLDSGWTRVHRHQGDERPFRAGAVQGKLPLRSALSSPPYFSPSPPPAPPACSARTVQCAMLRSVSRRSPLLSRPLRLHPLLHGIGAPCPSRLILRAEYVSTFAYTTRHFPTDPGPSAPSTSSSVLRGAPCYPGRVGSNGLLSGPQSLPRAHPSSAGLHIGHVRAFHSTPRREINPIPILAAVLKVSTSHPERAPLYSPCFSPLH